MSNTKASITDIFSSIQGEGLDIGKRQIFIRFANCNLNCKFCDTDYNNQKELSLQDVLTQVDDLNTERIHNSIVLTGGEPLCQSDFLKHLLPELQERGFKIFLETNGTLYDELGSLIEFIDTIAIDIKLPSVSKNASCWDLHKKFINIAFDKEFFIKIIVSVELDMADFDKAVLLMKEINFDIPFIIQPETRKDSLELNIEGSKLLELQQLALKSLNNVLVIPQAHKMLKVK